MDDDPLTDLGPAGEAAYDAALLDHWLAGRARGDARPRRGLPRSPFFLLTFDRLNHGIDNMPALALDVVGEDAAAHPYLVGGQARASRRGNGLFQIGHQADECVIELVDGIAGRTEYRITEQTDGTLCHCAILLQKIAGGLPDVGAIAAA